MDTIAPLGQATLIPSPVRLDSIGTPRLATVGRPVFYVRPDITVTDWVLTSLQPALRYDRPAYALSMDSVGKTTLLL